MFSKELWNNGCLGNNDGARFLTCPPLRLELCFSNFHVHMNQRGTLWNAAFELVTVHLRLAACISNELLVQGLLLGYWSSVTSHTLESGEPPCYIPGRWQASLSGPGVRGVDKRFLYPSLLHWILDLSKCRDKQANKISHKIDCFIDSWMTFLVFKRKGHTFKLGVKAHIETKPEIFQIGCAFSPLRFPKRKF